MIDGMDDRICVGDERNQMNLGPLCFRQPPLSTFAGSPVCRKDVIQQVAVRSRALLQPLATTRH